ncbi:MAG: 23S rRNA (uracil(1939)-C(5))-methyltransferase RlmD [Halothiobacillus sp.]
MRFPKLPKGEFPATIESLTLEGRGITHINGKATFISRALPGEVVKFVYTNRKKHFDEGDAVAIEQPSTDRIAPPCPHFDQCGACALQHLSAERQIEVKQQALFDQLQRIGKTEPKQRLPPLTGPVWGYRRRARLGVKYVIKKDRVLVGFRERRSHFLADISHCPVLDPRVGEHVTDIASAIGTLDARATIAQIEVSCSDDRVALVLRHLEPLSPQDKARLHAFGLSQNFDIYLQPGGTDSVHPLAPESITPLLDHQPDFDIAIGFKPLDFTQVNAHINREMVKLALHWLDIQPGDHALDLFAGLGNFTLPMARFAEHVTAIELETTLVQRAEQSARANGITHTTHQSHNLFEPDLTQPWMQKTYDRILLDPPRAGAEAMLPHIARFKPKRIVYISCHPGTLARDTYSLVHEHGYRLIATGVMDMFPHTTHIESIAVFEPK